MIQPPKLHLKLHIKEIQFPKPVCDLLQQLLVRGHIGKRTSQHRHECRRGEIDFIRYSFFQCSDNGFIDRLIVLVVFQLL